MDAMSVRCRALTTSLTSLIVQDCNCDLTMLVLRVLSISADAPCAPPLSVNESPNATMSDRPEAWIHSTDAKHSTRARDAINLCILICVWITTLFPLKHVFVAVPASMYTRRLPGRSVCRQRPRLWNVLKRSPDVNCRGLTCCTSRSRSLFNCCSCGFRCKGQQRACGCSRWCQL